MQLDAIKADQGGAAAEPVVPDKPLAQILADAKTAKEEAFQEQWKQMKTGVETSRASAGPRSEV